MKKAEPIPYMETTFAPTPTQELYTAVIERMLRDALHPNTFSDTKNSAKRWLMDNSICKHSFLWMCDICDISDKFIKRVRLSCLTSSTIQENNELGRKQLGHRRVS